MQTATASQQSQLISMQKIIEGSLNVEWTPETCLTVHVSVMIVGASITSFYWRSTTANTYFLKPSTLSAKH